MMPVKRQLRADALMVAAKVSPVLALYSSHNQSSMRLEAHLSGSVMLCAYATGSWTMTSVLAELESTGELLVRGKMLVIVIAI